jgi:TolB-like protein
MIEVLFLNKYLRLLSFVTLSILLLGISSSAFAAGQGMKIRTMVVMPFSTPDAGDFSIDVTHLVTDRLSRYNFDVIPQDALEGFLVERRIRRADFLDRSAIRAMGTTLKADALIMGSVGLLEDGENPKVSINAQMIDCLDAVVIWANSVSRTGADYATFLGLGKITSLKQLVEIAVDELLKGLPGTVNLDSSRLSPFEVVHASFSPDVLRGNESARLSIEVREITGKVRDIRAFVLDQEIDLTTEDGRWYSGAIRAPTVEGIYPLKIYVTDRWNRLFSVDAMASLMVQNTPPEVALSFRQRVISPNNDGINDYVLCIPEVLRAMALQTWTVEIVDRAGVIVRSEDGMGALPEGFVWRGENNQYKTVADGAYFCRLVVEDKAGNRTATTREKILVDTTPPEVTLTVAQDSEDSVILALKADDVSAINDWQIIVYQGTDAEGQRFEGHGEVPITLKLAKKKRITS